MLKQLLIILFLFTFISCKYKKEFGSLAMQKYLNDTKELVKQKDYKTALEHYIWFQDHALEYDQAMSGVRLSFALSDWKSLAEVYPPAMKSMIEMRDKKTRQFINNGKPLNLFADVSALNRTLDETQKTIDLFEMITKKYPDDSRFCWIYTKNILFNAKRYDIIRNYIGNPLIEFDVVKENYNRDTMFYHNPKMNSAHFKLHNEKTFVENTLELINFAIANKDITSAKEIQKQALNIVKDYRLENAIPV